jgi:hypothetical protein
MTEQDVVNLMKSSNSEAEWNNNADKVKKAFGGEYPRFWYPAILLSGIANETIKKWDGH